MNSTLVELLSRYEKAASFNHEPFSDETKKAIENKLGVVLPEQYVTFLKLYGHGGLDGFEILGMGIDGSSIFLDETMEYRQFGLPCNLIVVEDCDEWQECLDCETGQVVSWSIGEEATQESFSSFDDYLLDRIENAMDNMA